MSKYIKGILSFAVSTASALAVAAAKSLLSFAMSEGPAWRESGSLDGISSPESIDDAFDIQIDEDCADQNEEFFTFTDNTENIRMSTLVDLPTSSVQPSFKRQRPSTPRTSLLVSPTLSDPDLENGLLIKSENYTSFPQYNNFSSLPVSRPLGALDLHCPVYPTHRLHDGARPSSIACALVAQMQSLLVAGALMHLTASNMHPIGEGEYATLEWTMSALLALCKRAELQEDEITPQMVLTLLWMCESWACAGISLSSALERYTAYEPSHRTPAFKRALRSDMLSLQIYVLKSCNWRMALNLNTDLNPARSDLEVHPTFQDICAQIRDGAMHWASMLTAPAPRMVSHAPPKMIIPLFQMTSKAREEFSERTADLLMRPDE